MDIFSLLYLFYLLSPSLWETARYRLKYCLKGPLNPSQPTNQSISSYKKGPNRLYKGGFHLSASRCDCAPTICMSKAVLTALLERSTCPHHRSLLSFRMRSRSSMPSRASSSVDLMLAVSCGLTLQIYLIIALSFRCRCWRLGFVNCQVSLALSIALRTQELYTWPRVLKERWLEKRTGISSLNFFQGGFHKY